MMVQLTDTTSILSRWEQFFSNLLNVNQSSSLKGGEIYTIEPDIPEPSLVEVELTIENLLSRSRSYPIRINSSRWR